MSSDYSPSGGRRSSRRGGQRRGRRRSGPTSGSRSERPSKPVKKTLWQQIVAFFSGGSGESSKPAKTNGSYTSSHSSDSASVSAPAEARPRKSAPTVRKPENVEVTSPRIYVGNLSFDASESDLFDLFNGVGLVQNVEVVANRHTQKSKGFAFVEMQSIEEAQRAVTELHDKEYMGRKLVVSGAKAADEKRSERSRQPEQ